MHRTIRHLNYRIDLNHQTRLIHLQLKGLTHPVTLMKVIIRSIVVFNNARLFVVVVLCCPLSYVYKVQY